MRITADGYEVTDGEGVYEVLWKYHNAECSEAVPHRTTSKDVPRGFKIWKHEAGCRNECVRLNYNQWELLTELINKSR